jgi:hypothetical protein
LDDEEYSPLESGIQDHFRCYHTMITVLEQLAGASPLQVIRQIRKTALQCRIGHPVSCREVCAKMLAG